MCSNEHKNSFQQTHTHNKRWHNTNIPPGLGAHTSAPVAASVEFYDASIILLHTHATFLSHWSKAQVHHLPSPLSLVNWKLYKHMNISTEHHWFLSRADNYVVGKELYLIIQTHYLCSCDQILCETLKCIITKLFCYPAINRRYEWKTPELAINFKCSLIFYEQTKKSIPIEKIYAITYNVNFWDVLDFEKVLRVGIFASFY